VSVNKQEIRAIAAQAEENLEIGVEKDWKRRSETKEIRES
jgi:hypothetical protein